MKIKRALDQQGEVAQFLEKLETYFEQGKIVVKKTRQGNILVDVEECY